MARASRPRSGRSCSCRTTRRNGAAAASVWRSFAASSPSTAAASTSPITHHAARGLQSSFRAEMKPLILIVDDEPGVRASLMGVLKDEGYEVEAVPSGEACLERLTRGPVDLIVLDVWLPGMDGLATLARLRERQVDAQGVLISGHGHIESAVPPLKKGALDLLLKPPLLEKTVLCLTKAPRPQRL